MRGRRRRSPFAAATTWITTARVAQARRDRETVKELAFAVLDRWLGELPGPEEPK